MSGGPMVTQTVCMKVGDRRPVLRVQLGLHGDGSNPLAGAVGVRFVMKSAKTNATKVDAAATIESLSEKIVAYEWQAGDTGQPGRFFGHFVVDYGSGVTGSFPSCGHIEIHVES